MNKKTLSALRKLNACQEAITWAETQANLDDAWENCTRGDWMLWLAGKLAGKPWSKERKPLVLAACTCARLALPFLPAGENGPHLAIETAEKWAIGKASKDEVRAAAAYAAYPTAYAAAYAAAAHATVSVAAVAVAAVAAAVAAAKRKKILAECADIVRTYYPKAPKL